MTDHAIARRGGRVIVIDATDRVLLLESSDLARPIETYWVTPGGGLEPGESTAVAAARELYEETGLSIAAAQLGAPVHRDTVEFLFDDRWYRQVQDFFLARVESWDVVPTTLGDIEASTWRGARWWSVDELRVTAERFYPRELPDLLGTLAEEAVGC